MNGIKEITIKDIAKEVFVNLGIEKADLDIPFNFWYSIVRRLFYLMFNIMRSTDQLINFTRINTGIATIKELTDGKKFLLDFVDLDETKIPNKDDIQWKEEALLYNGQIWTTKASKIKQAYQNNNKGIFAGHKTFHSYMDIERFTRLQPTARLLFKARLVKVKGCGKRATKILDADIKIKKNKKDNEKIH